uniref:Uncharacterized protein n=1 Tax=Panagrolaimus sp. JU765 TaxID=591449 RepID=A0AC34Q2C5_9BILA
MYVPLLLLFCFLNCVNSKQFICPNNGAAKVDSNGEEIQCLPGQAAELVCGRGYSCYFGGFNYRCCPTADEDYDDSLHGADCPLGSLNVLDATGTPIKCNPRNGKCPDSNMFCARHNSHAVCCENLGKSSVPAESKPETKAATVPKTTEKPKSKVSILDLECPAKSLTVLGDNGEPILCQSSRNCPTENMYCHTTNQQSICCESLETAKDKLETKSDVEDSDRGQNPLKYTPQKIAELQDEIKIQNDLERAIVGKEKEKQLISTPKPKKQKLEAPQKPKESKKPKAPRNYADNQNTKRISFKKESKSSEFVANRKIHENPRAEHPRTFGIRTDTRANHDKVVVEYQPHTQGGYAISRKLEKINSPKISSTERKSIAQQYIVEQIRQGWPYDEKFYRPENIAVIKNGQRTEAVVHFPN